MAGLDSLFSGNNGLLLATGTSLLGSNGRTTGQALMDGFGAAQNFQTQQTQSDYLKAKQEQAAKEFEMQRQAQQQAMAQQQQWQNFSGSQRTDRGALPASVVANADGQQPGGLDPQALNMAQVLGNGPPTRESAFFDSIRGLPVAEQQAAYQKKIEDDREFQMDMMKPTADMKNYGWAYGDQAPQAYAANQTRASDRSTKVNFSPTVIAGKQQSAYADKVGGAYAEQFVDTQKAASDTYASDSRAQILVDQAKSNPENFGSIQSMTLGARSALDSLGIDTEQFFKLGNVGQQQMVQAAANQMLLNSTGGLGAQVSNSDREFYVRSLANLGNPAAVAENLAKLTMADNQLKRDLARAQREYVKGTPGQQLDAGWQDRAAEVIQNFKGYEPLRQNTRSMGGGQSNIDDLVSKYQ